MPELPEVESICRSLRPQLEGSLIRSVAVRTEGVLLDRGGAGDGEPAAVLAGRQLLSVSRRGKYLLFKLSGGLTLLAHMRMTGQLLLRSGAPAAAEETSLPRHTHLVFLLEPARDADGVCGTDYPESIGLNSVVKEQALSSPCLFSLLFVDVRRFGRFELYLDKDLACGAGGFSKLGPEPLGPDFTGDYLWAGLKGHAAAPVKNILLNQKLLAGLGNIYADESLFQAGIHPLRPGASLCRWETEKLFAAIRRILAFAVRVRGTSFSDYVDARGHRGGFSPYLCVYGRGGQACRRCQSRLEKTKIAGRGTVFCPQCQPRHGRTRALSPAQAIYNLERQGVFFLKRREFRAK